MKSNIIFLPFWVFWEWNLTVFKYYSNWVHVLLSFPLAFARRSFTTCGLKTKEYLETKSFKWCKVGVSSFQTLFYYGLELPWNYKCSRTLLEAWTLYSNEVPACSQPCRQWTTPDSSGKSKSKRFKLISYPQCVTLLSCCVRF